jgi:digeranylgeranylglycerophospholipid reductase
MKMKTYDVIVVGAGPAGGQCARDLVAKGFKVLLVDKAKNFLENNYSSGGGPLSMMTDFDLPPSIVGAYWNKLNIESTKEKNVWTSDSPFGPVLDFDRLRQFLSDETQRMGGDFQLGLQYVSHRIQNDEVEVRFKNLESHEDTHFRSKFLVDATGTDRKIIEPHKNENASLPATGIEFHIKVSPDIYKKYSHSLNFFLGHGCLKDMDGFFRWLPIS